MHNLASHIAHKLTSQFTHRSQQSRWVVWEL